MKRSLLFFISFVALLWTIQIPVQAQVMSEEVSQLMNKSLSLYQNGKYKDALDGFLKVGEQTSSQRTEIEHQVYTCSQTMAVMCYQHLGDSKNAFRLAEEVLECNETLSSIMERLSERLFYRCHKSFLVNMKYVESFNHTDLMLQNKESIMISRQKYKSFCDAYSEFLVKSKAI